MTTRNSFRKRPPFPFVNRARANNLPCDAKISTRGSTPFYYPEFVMFPGPQEIAVTGDNSYETLFGATWALLFCDDNHLYVLQWNGAGWDVITEQLPVFPEFDGTERAFTAAFDQSARLIYAYEKAGGITVTRWDDTAGAYVQDVSVTGVDPCVVMDATWAYDIPNSDVLLFYLSTDRTRVLCRVQREIYANEYEVWDYGQAVILDRALAVFLRYQLLVADLAGEPLETVLLSDPYPYLGRESMTGSAAPPTAGEYLDVVLNGAEVTPLVGFASPPAGGVYANPLIHYDADPDSMVGSAAPPSAGKYGSPVLNEVLDPDPIVGAASPATGGEYVDVVLNANPGAESMVGSASPPTGGSYDPA